MPIMCYTVASLDTIKGA